MMHTFPAGPAHETGTQISTLEITMISFIPLSVNQSVSQSPRRSGLLNLPVGTINPSSLSHSPAVSKPSYFFSSRSNSWPGPPTPLSAPISIRSSSSFGSSHHRRIFVLPALPSSLLIYARGSPPSSLICTHSRYLQFLLPSLPPPPPHRFDRHYSRRPSRRSGSDSTQTTATARDKVHFSRGSTTDFLVT